MYIEVRDRSALTDYSCGTQWHIGQVSIHCMMNRRWTGGQVDRPSMIRAKGHMQKTPPGTTGLSSSADILRNIQKYRNEMRCIGREITCIDRQMPCIDREMPYIGGRLSYIRWYVQKAGDKNPDIARGMVCYRRCRLYAVLADRSTSGRQSEVTFPP